MSTVIRVENLSKSYTLKHQGQSSGNGLRHALQDMVSAPFRRGRNKSPANGSSEETFWALKDVSFEVKQGEVLGIIGRNGAGKSTLLKVLSRITEPTKGRVGLKGRVASLLEVGTGFHPELTGRENIFLNGAILGMTRSEIKSKFDEIVAFAEVEKFLDTPVKRYSSGMYVRLAFAVAAHLEPEILIVDEVLAVGDSEFQKKCLGKMKDVAGNGRTVIFVSHNMGAVSNLCQVGLVMKSGQIIKTGKIAECIQAYIQSASKSEQNTTDQCRLKPYRDIPRQVEIIDISYFYPNAASLFGDCLKFKLVLSSISNESGISIGGSIFDSGGTAIGTFFSQPCLEVKALTKSELLVELALDGLAPGHYTAGFSVGKGDQETQRQDWDVVVGLPSFEVLSAGQDSHVSQWNTSWGNLCLNSAVKVHKV
jgi:lipopolysaccharide transport system ATP-binding protein